MSRHRNMKQMIQEDYYDDDYYDDEDYYDDYDDGGYVAPPKKKAAANGKQKQQQQQTKQTPKQKKQQQSSPKKESKSLTSVATASTATGTTSSKLSTSTGAAGMTATTNTAAPTMAASPPVPAILQPSSISASATSNPQRTHLTVVVLGHVDAGKSTITGHLLYHASSQGDGPRRHAHHTSKLNYAWLLDEDEQERQHGITMDVATKTLQTPRYNLVLCDAPGHADYVPAAISGAAAADAAMLTVGATDFQASFGAGQLREHALLAKGLGVNTLVVTVTKMDLVKWSQEAYQAIVDPLCDFLVHQVGFQRSKVHCVPVSGLQGENVFESPATVAPWYQGPTLWQALDAIEAPANKSKLLEKPTRILLTDVTPSGTVRAKVVQGWIQVQQDVVVWPVGDVTKVTKLKRITDDLEQPEETSSNKERSQYAAAGELFDCVLPNVDPTRLSPGHILTRPSQRPPLSNKCRARIWLLSCTNFPTVIIKGAQVTMHMHQLDVPCHFANLVRSLQKDGTPGKERPRALTSQNTPAAVVDLQLLVPICMEAFGDCRALGRFVLRRAGDSVAVGRIEQVLS